MNVERCMEIRRPGGGRGCSGPAPEFAGLVPSPLALAPNRWILTAALAWFGVCAGAMNVSMNAQAIFLEHNYGRPIVSSFHALFSLGGMTGASIGGIASARGLTLLRHFEIAIPIFLVAAVISGLSEGETIVVDGLQRVRVGQPVAAGPSPPRADAPAR